MHKKLLTSALTIIAVTTLHAQQLKDARRTERNRKTIHIPPPEKNPTPAIDSSLKIWHRPSSDPKVLNAQRNELIRILTDARYQPYYIPIASHRAQWSGQTEPENSMRAIYHVIDMNKVDIIELDLKKSSDDTVYVMHDNYLQRTTDFLDKFLGFGTGQPSDMFGHYNNYTWNQVKTLTLKMPDFTYTSQAVPTFYEALYYVRNRSSLLINLDIGDMNVFRKTWDLVKKYNAFDVCIFKTAQLTVAQFRQQYYDELPQEQKEKVIFFPMIVANPSGYSSPMAQYDAWENSGLAKGYEIGYRKGGDKESELLDVTDAIHQTNRVRVHVFNTLPDNYKGRYLGNVNINQCCNDAYDSRGDWDYLFNPRPNTKGANGYVITDDVEMLGQYLGQP